MPEVLPPNRKSPAQKSFKCRAMSTLEMPPPRSTPTKGSIVPLSPTPLEGLSPSVYCSLHWECVREWCVCFLGPCDECCVLWFVAQPPGELADGRGTAQLVGVRLPLMLELVSDSVAPFGKPFRFSVWEGLEIEIKTGNSVKTWAENGLFVRHFCHQNADRNNTVTVSAARKERKLYRTNRK